MIKLKYEKYKSLINAYQQIPTNTAEATIWNDDKLNFNIY